MSLCLCAFHNGTNLCTHPAICKVGSKNYNAAHLCVAYVAGHHEISRGAHGGLSQNWEVPHSRNVGVSVNVELSDNVLCLKAKIKESEGIEIEAQRLVFNKQELQSACQQ